MRARTINETLKFERNIDPKDAMKTGLWRNIHTEEQLKELFPSLTTLHDFSTYRIYKANDKNGTEIKVNPIDRTVGR